jgi:Spy/CpxP family protein refolding chaperone
MKTSAYRWIKFLAIVATTLAIAPASFAGAPPSCPPHDGPPPGVPGPGPMRPPLHDVELSAAQQDTLFELTLAQELEQRSTQRKADQAIEQLQRLATGERFNAEEARRLADSYARALARVALSQAELEVKLRTLLTPEQRQQIAASRAPAGRPQPGPRDAHCEH